MIGIPNSTVVHAARGLVQIARHHGRPSPIQPRRYISIAARRYGAVSASQADSRKMTVKTDIYLDHNATTPMWPSVMEKITESLQYWGNPSSAYGTGAAAKVKIELAREQVAAMVHAKAEDIVFMSGGTEANNTVVDTAIKEYARRTRGTIGTTVPHVIVSNMEHDSVIKPARVLEQEGRIELSVVEAEPWGAVTPEAIRSALRDNTVLVSVMHSNNETGVIQPIREIAAAVRTYATANSLRIFMHTDAAQSLGKIKVDVEELGCDYVTIVGHKQEIFTLKNKNLHGSPQFYGPRIGALYVSRLMRESDRQHAPLYALLHGGGQERGFRSGTEITPMIIGLGEAGRVVSERLHADEKHMREVRDYLERRLVETFGQDGVAFNGKSHLSQRLPNTCNFSILGEMYAGSSVLSFCQQVRASVGSACHAGQTRPSAILLSLGIPFDVARNAMRFSVGRLTTIEDIDKALHDIQYAVEQLKREGTANQAVRA